MSSLPKCKFRTIELPGFPAIELSFVQGGKGTYGSDGSEAIWFEKPVHEAIMSDFWMMRYPVSQSLYAGVMGDSNPSYFLHGRRPVEIVRWNEAMSFAERLNEILNGSRKQGLGEFSLPTEHQWEYVARGGVYALSHDMESYSGGDDMDEVGWYDENGFDCTMTPGLKRPNQLGLFDMSGNVWEWYADPWEIYFYKRLKNKTIIDPVATGDNVGSIIRGGSWRSNARGCRAAYRNWWQRVVHFDYLGFRLIFSLFAGDP